MTRKKESRVSRRAKMLRVPSTQESVFSEKLLSSSQKMVRFSYMSVIASLR
jgi:hypothetical protein